MTAPNQKDDSRHQFSPEEQKRVDELFTAARRFHYWAFVCAGLSLLLSMLERNGKFTLPFGGVDVPYVQASVALYLTAIVLVAGADRFAVIALYWATLSIYLLYWVRLLRQLFITLVLFLPVLAVITPWRGPMKELAGYSIIAAVGLHAIRCVGPCVFRRIDRLGGRVGFPDRSEHY